MTGHPVWEVVSVIWMVYPLPESRENQRLTFAFVDASVTQSALEEALASNMQAGGGMASRMSSISQALRSKYLN